MAEPKWVKEWQNFIGDHKYIAIKNWEFYQSENTVEWIKDYVDKEWVDEDYRKLSELCRYVIDGMRRLRGRLRQNLTAHDLPTMVSCALHVTHTNRPHIPYAVLTLGIRHFLVPTNEQFNFLDKSRIDKNILELEYISPNGEVRSKSRSKSKTISKRNAAAGAGISAVKIEEDQGEV